MAKYVPSPRDWVREQVELYENSGGTKGTTLRDTGLPVVLVTHWGNKTGAIRKTPLMRVKDGDNYILVGSQGGAPKDPAWAHNLRVNHNRPRSAVSPRSGERSYRGCYAASWGALSVPVAGRLHFARDAPSGAGTGLANAPIPAD
jgi:deazaflavin-dependent oxidoreductase (nitroreductase family)